MEKEWLDIFCTLAAGITVTYMTDCHLSRQQRYLLFTEDLIYESVTLYSMKCTIIVDGHDSAALLTSMLKGVQAIVSKACSILNTIYSNYTTFVMQLVISILIHL